MISRNRLIETELIKQRTLIVVLTSHHRPSPTKLCRQKTESLFAKTSKSLLQQNLHIADMPVRFANVRYWSESGHWLTVDHQPQFIALEKLPPGCRSIVDPKIGCCPNLWRPYLIDRVP